jgi:hypothetical protein
MMNKDRNKSKGELTKIFLRGQKLVNNLLTNLLILKYLIETLVFMEQLSDLTFYCSQLVVAL